MPVRRAKERFAMYLPGPMLALLDAEAERTGTDKASLIRQAVDFYFLFKVPSGDAGTEQRVCDELRVMARDRCPQDPDDEGWRA